MQLTIPDDAVVDQGLTENDLLRELAVALYRRGKITIGHGCRIARLSEIDFQRLLSDRDVEIRYPQDALDEDLKTISMGL